MPARHVGLRTRFVIIFIALSLVGLGTLYLLIDRAVRAPNAPVDSGVIHAFIAGGAIYLALAAAGSYLAVRSVSRTIRGYARAVERGESEALELLVSPVANQFQRLMRDLLRVDSRLEEEHARYNAVLRGMDAGVFAIDGDGRMTVCNPAFQDLFGVPNDWDGRPYGECIASARLNDAVEEARGGRAVRLELELGEAPSSRIVVAHVSPLGRLDGVATTVRDVTAIRYLERVRRDFVANISHELRTPIAVIRASAETLLDGALDDPPVARDFVEQVERHSTRMGNIVEGLLELARLEAGQQALAREAVSIRPAVQRAIDLTAHRVRDRKLVVTLDVPEDLFALADTKGLDQVLSNLVENAAKYATEGGVVTVQAVGRDDSVWVRVEDDGPGIAPKHRARIFERFYRVDKGRSRDMGGTGLGLAIVRHLTLAMGGEVFVEDASGGGACFTVRLARAKDLGTETDEPS